MSPAVATLTLHLAYLLVAFGLRAWIMHRRIGSSGYRGLSGRPRVFGRWALLN